MRRALVAGSLLLLVVPGVPRGAAAGGSFSLTDSDGVVHFTNAPTDPRYQRMGSFSATAAGWLRLPAVVQARYGQEIREVAGRYGIATDLVEAVIRVESAFNPWAVSPKGAQGLMQLMPRTAQALGVQNAFDPRQNIEGGVRHLRYLIDRYPGNLPLALAAYNAGEGAVNQYQGIPPYTETRQYVRRILDLHGGGLGFSQVIFRYQDPDGTVTYTNVPPSSRLRLR